MEEHRPSYDPYVGRFREINPVVLDNIYILDILLICINVCVALYSNSELEALPGDGT